MRECGCPGPVHCSLLLVCAILTLAYDAWATQLKYSGEPEGTLRVGSSDPGGASIIRSLSQSGPSCFTNRSMLILGGAHHRTGSELLSRCMSAVCKHCFGVAHWKNKAVSARQPCRVGTDGEALVERSTAAILSSYMKGLRLLSSGRWILSPGVWPPRPLPVIPAYI